MSKLSNRHSIQHSLDSSIPTERHVASIALDLYNQVERLTLELRSERKMHSDSRKRENKSNVRCRALEKQVKNLSKKNQRLEDMVKNQPNLVAENKELAREAEYQRKRADAQEKRADRNEKKRQEALSALKKEQAAHRQTQLMVESLECQLNRQTHQNSQTSNLPSSLDFGPRSKAKDEKNEEKPKSEESTAAAAKADKSEEDKPIKRPPTSSRKPSGRKRGGQPNHPCHKKGLCDNPDEIIEKKVSEIPWGAEAVRDENGNLLYYAAQTTTMKLTAVITEIHYYLDPQGETLSQKEMDTFRVGASTYSDEFRAICVFLLIYGKIPYGRLVKVIQSMTRGQIKFSPGTIAKWAQKLSKQSKEERSKILDRILQSSVVHVDETGVKVSGKLHWVHAIANKSEVVYILTESRGDKETSPTAILRDREYKGTVVHDHFSTYQSLENVRHAECNVHISRYMRNGETYDHCDECDEMLDLFSDLLALKDKGLEEGRKGATDQEYQEAKAKMIDICTRAMNRWESRLAESNNPDKMKKCTPPYYTTCRRMKKNPEEYLRFYEDFEVPFGNNIAEQCMGAFKAKMKVSKQFVTIEGGEAVTNLMTVVESHKNEDLLEIFTDLMSKDF